MALGGSRFGLYTPPDDRAAHAGKALIPGRGIRGANQPLWLRADRRNMFQIGTACETAAEMKRAYPSHHRKAGEDQCYSHPIGCWG